MRRRKGQYGVIEQVIIFGFGIAIAIGFLVAFESFGRDVNNEALKDQRELLADLVSLHVVELAKAGTQGSINFNLPGSAADEDYIIEFQQGGVAVLAGGGAYVSSNLNGLEDRYELEGEVSNDFQTATITLQDNKITVEGS